MISLIISLLSGVLCAVAYLNLSKDASWGAYIMGLIGTLVSFYFINRKIQKPLNEIIKKVQDKLQDAAEQSQKKINHFQSRPGGNQAAVMKTIEKIQKDATEEAMAILVDAQPYYKWNFLIEKQINSMRFQLNYQVKNFEEADKYMGAVWLMDPSIITMKMARIYKLSNIARGVGLDAAQRKSALKNWEVSKVFNKGRGRLKGQNAAFVYSTYAWMLVKNGFTDEALEILNEGSKKSADEVILQNIDRLRNGKEKSFSNAKYGEKWYALYLEEPPKQKPQVVRQNARNTGRPF
jgi:hypothetical protein